MTTTSHADLRNTRLTFGGILRSEIIKLWTLRSTFWCCVIVILLTIGVGLLLSTIQRPGATTPNLSYAEQQAMAVLYATGGTGIGQLVFSVLGVLVISGEYGTGMIRATFAADPKRLGTMFGKAIVLGVTTFVVALIAVFGTVAVCFPLMHVKGVYPDLGNSKVLLSLFGAAAYLAVISLIAFSIGAIIRSTAAGIATAIGLVLVVPAILGIVAATTGATWAYNIIAFLPTNAGAKVYDYNSSAPSGIDGVISLDAYTGGLVLLGWFVVLFVVSLVLVKRRDA
ncbi:MAG TPA: ABC transporter permease [Galbitalea sp.]|jgi:ABC-2 type transport system permease protein